MMWNDGRHPECGGVSTRCIYMCVYGVSDLVWVSILLSQFSTRFPIYEKVVGPDRDLVSQFEGNKDSVWGSIVMMFFSIFINYSNTFMDQVIDVL